MMPRPVRVILADDHTLVRSGIRRILESQSGLKVVGEAADGQGALAAVRSTDADVLVLDLKMNVPPDGLEVLRIAKSMKPELKVLILTMYAGREYVSRAVQDGADGYLLKDSAVHDLVAAVERVMSGGSYYSPAIQQTLAELLREGGAPQSVQALTDREREVLTLLAKGLSSKDIGTQLDISTRTVETHRANLMRKLGVKSVALLTQVAIREGILDEPLPPR